LHRVAGAIPLKAYADYPFKVCVNDTFDRFSAPLEWRFTAAEVKEMLADTGFADIVVLDNFGWTASGRHPLGGIGAGRADGAPKERDD
jgi:hypothetical protein